MGRGIAAHSGLSRTTVCSSSASRRSSPASARARSQRNCSPLLSTLVGLDPTRRRGEADGGEQAGDLLDRPLAQPVDHRPVGRPLPRPVDAVAEHGPGDGALAAARRADDQADVPRRRDGEMGRRGDEETEMGVAIDLLRLLISSSPLSPSLSSTHSGTSTRNRCDARWPAARRTSRPPAARGTNRTRDR